MVSEKTVRSRLKSWRKRILGKTPGSIVFNVCLYAVFLGFAFVMFYPFWHVLSQSFTETIVTDIGPREQFGIAAYTYLLTNKDIWWRFCWSLIVSVIFTVLHVFFCMLSAYPLSKKYLRGRVKILVFIVFTMLFSGGMIPFYVLMGELGLMNNPLIYFLPGLVSGFDIIICKNYLQGIPESLAESAKLDGANDYTIFLVIYLPLSLPIMATIGLWAFVGKWNDWMTGVLYMSRYPDLQLIQTLLRTILNTSGSMSGDGSSISSDIISKGSAVRMAIVVFGTLPIVLMYPFIQKYFVKGVILGSVKE